MKAECSGVAASPAIRKCFLRLRRKLTLRSGFAFSWAVCVCLWVPTALAQDSSDRERGVTYALRPGKPEISIDAGFYRIEATDYSPGGKGMLGGNLGIGITRGLSAQVGATIAGYRNDLYFSPYLPTNPYLATANVLAFLGGLRYEFRNPRKQLRPYVGGGGVAVRFANVKRGPRQFCFPNASTGFETCLDMTPELFENTRFTGYFEAGLNLCCIRELWGFQVGARLYRLNGVTEQSFWHNQFFGGLLVRWQ